MKRIYKPKQCKCGVEFTPKGPASKFCESCAEVAKQESRDKEYVKRCIAKGINCGAGTGNFEHAKGKESPCYSSGKGEYVRAREVLLKERKCCERCNKNLLNVSSRERVIHHRDHDRSNNDWSNFELLCKRCHQLEHDCESRLMNV